MQGQGVAVISDGTALKGEIRNIRQLDVFGYVEGRILGGKVVIHPGGRVFGTIKSNDIEVMGTFQGDASVRSLLHIGSTGVVRGNVRYGKLAVEAGGELEADVRNVPPELGGDLNLVVRRGASVRITTVDLTAFDPDDSAKSLTFNIGNISKGFIAQASAPTVAVTQFTQADLESGGVLFVHDGSEGERASFDAVVIDKAGATSGAAQVVTVAVLAA